MKIIIRDGTSRDDEDICRECDYFYCRKDRRGELRLCTSHPYPLLLKLPVYECTDFSQKHSIPLYELKKMAWILRPHRGKIGFIPYDSLSPEEKEKIEGEPIVG